MRGDTRSQIDRLMDSVQSFDIYCEGPAEDWQDNSSIPLKSSSARLLSGSCSALVSPRSKLVSPAAPLSSKEVKSPLGNKSNNSIMENDHTQDEGTGDAPEPPLDVYYFANSSKLKDEPWIKTVEFGIPAIRLETSDRRVLSSTVESLLSKNENLILITTSFMRDVLLNDFPPETFIQESALCMVSFRFHFKIQIHFEF